MNGQLRCKPRKLFPEQSSTLEQPPNILWRKDWIKKSTQPYQRHAQAKMLHTKVQHATVLKTSDTEIFACASTQLLLLSTRALNQPTEVLVNAAVFFHIQTGLKY